MNNLEFFKACFSNEIKPTVDVIKSLPSEALNYRPHEKNRSAREIVEHLLCHLVDLKIIAKHSACDEAMVYGFEQSADAAEDYATLSAEVLETIGSISEEDWENENVALSVNGKNFVTLKRTEMMWFFYFDIIHHRGQLTSYIRPMGGKNPAVYGYSADTV